MAREEQAGLLGELAVMELVAAEIGLARAKRALEAIGYLIIIIGIIATAVYLLQYNPGFFSLP